MFKAKFKVQAEVNFRTKTKIMERMCNKVKSYTQVRVKIKYMANVLRSGSKL